MSEATWARRLREAEYACRSALTEPGLQAMTNQASGRWTGEEGCFSALSKVTDFAASVSELQSYARTISAKPHVFEQWLLLQAALAAMPQAAVYPVCGEVKALWAEEVMFAVRAPAAWLPTAFSLGHVRFGELARIMTLRRFPAGQFHWEMSGLPRSYALRTSPRQWHRLLRCVMRQVGGFAPMAEIHANVRRKNRLTLTQSEGMRSYYLVAKSLEQQPQVRGLLAISWLYCENTARVSPKLAWLREFLQKNGAFLGTAGPAPAESGFLTGSDERRTLYENGAYQPQIGYAVWPRRAMLEWAKSYQAEGRAALA